MKPAAPLLLLALLAAAPARAAEPTRRFAVVAGAREGGPGRVTLRYSTSDAREVSDVLRVLGGVAPGDVLLLEDPTPAALRSALGTVSARAAEVKARGGRSELFVYYSGHSDAEGLLLGKERLSYKDLRAELDRAPTEVRVAILDSCASGAFTRSKGGVFRPPFLLDASSRLRGHAFLTSSAADEASQESDRLKASFFTHALLTGMRGAADANGDARVTLNEAYQFAFQETLAQTESTKAGPQHATYDIGLVGSGDVVLTDLRLAGATLVIPEALEGRVFVRDATGLLVAELRKVKGTPVELALPPGDYQVRVARGERVDAGTFAVPGNGRVVVVPEKLFAAPAEVNTVRGEAGPAEPEAPAAAPPAQPPRRVFVDVGIFPPLTVNDAAGRPALNHLSLGVPVSYSDRLEGLGVGAAAHGAGDVTGAQVGGAAAWSRGAVLGVQVGGAAAISGRLTGVQVAGAVTWAKGPAKAIQVAGALAYLEGDAQVVQVSGGASVVNGALEGIQVAGAFAGARSLEGIQLAPVNVAGKVDGVQIGVVNVGGRVHGAQIGVVNISEDVDLPLGLVNIVADGRQHLEVFATETSAVNVAVKLGNRTFHSVLTAGVDAGSHAGETRWTAGAGLGVHLPLLPRLSLDVDAISQTVYYGSSDPAGTRALVTLRPTFAWQVAPRFALFAAPSANLFVTRAGEHGDVGFLSERNLNEGGRNDARLFAGFAVGARI